MKKATRFCLITAGSLFLIGFIILLICTVIKGFPFVNDVLSQAHIEAPNFVNSEFNFDSSYPVYDCGQEDLKVAKDSDIKNLSIECGDVSLILSSSSDEYFHISTEDTSHRFQYYTKNDTLHILGFKRTSNTSGNAVMRLEVPADISLEQVVLSLGAGSVEMDALQANDISFEVGAGFISAASLTADTLQIEIGAGSTELSDAHVQDANIEVGMGSVTYSGLISQDLHAECSMGEITLLLDDAFEDHDYVLECAAGSMDIGPRHYSGLAYEETISNQADSTYVLSSSMGDISISFQ